MKNFSTNTTKKNNPQPLYSLAPGEIRRKHRLIRIWQWLESRDEFSMTFREYLLGTLAFGFVIWLLLVSFTPVLGPLAIFPPYSLAALVNMAYYILPSLVVGWAITATRKEFIRDFSELWSLTARGYNDNASSIAYTLKLVRKAEKWLLFYDYGEDEAGNVYHSTEVAQELIAKLQAQPEFQLSLIFRNPEEEVVKLPLIAALREWQAANKKEGERVNFTFGIERGAAAYEEFNRKCQDFPYHYKINDRADAYLTQHEEQEGGKTRRLYRYSTIWIGWPLARVADSLAFHNAVLGCRNSTSSREQV